MMNLMAAERQGFPPNSFGLGISFLTESGKQWRHGIRIMIGATPEEAGQILKRFGERLIEHGATYEEPKPREDYFDD